MIVAVLKQLALERPSLSHHACACGIAALLQALGMGPRRPMDRSAERRLARALRDISSDTSISQAPGAENRGGTSTPQALLVPRARRHLYLTGPHDSNIETTCRSGTRSLEQRRTQHFASEQFK